MKTPTTPLRDQRIGKALALKGAHGIVTKSDRRPTSGERLAAYFMRRELGRELRNWT